MAENRPGKRLWRGLPRPDRITLRRFLAALHSRYGPMDLLSSEWARLTAELWFTTAQASEAALAEGAKRRHGKGRRPTAQDVDRRLKRQGLGVTTLDSMLRRLEELARPLKRPVKAADLVAQQRARAGGGA